MSESRSRKVSIADLGSGFCTAIRFLTIIPVSWRADRDGDYFQQSIYFFPVIGLLIGLGAKLLVSVGLFWFPQAVCCFLLLFYLSFISGFLHLDGLADSGDGLMSARPADVSLEIMKDSRTGAMGVVFLVAVMLGKFAALSSLPKPLFFAAAFFMPIAGRCSILITMAMYRYARAEGGIGGMFYSDRARKAAFTGIVLLFLVASLLGGIEIVLAVGGAVAATVLGFGTFCKQRLGGVTGDTLGAMCEITEMSVAIALTALI